MVWRSTNATRCTRCDGAYGRPFRLDDLRASHLMDAMADFGNEEEYKDEGDDIMRLALVMEDHCQWFNYEDPWYTQTCWMVLREYADPTPHIEKAMEIFEAQFQERVVLVDDRGDVPSPHPSPVDLHMG